MLTSQIEDGSGRVVVHTKDDRGEPESYNAPQVGDFSASGVFEEKITITMNREEGGHGSYRLGTLLLNAQVVPGPTFTGTFLALEVQVIGYIGTSPTVIKSTIFGAFINQDVVTFTDEVSYDYIGLAGRKLVDGVPDATTAVQALTLQASGRFTR